MSTPTQEAAPQDDALEGRIESPAEVLAREQAAPGYDPEKAIATSPTAEIVKAHGFDLTFRQDQTELNPKQRAALSGVLNFDPQESVEASAHVQAFLHLCVARRLDPFAREVYLMARGEQGRNRNYTMQVGIDGYYRMAAGTGRFIQFADNLWTGTDDADSAWFQDGDGVMRRRWFDFWPESRGHPGAARAIVVHYGAGDLVVRTPGNADWKMYAPEVPAWEWGEKRGQKVYLKNPDGTQKMTLNEMWEKGGPHMLAKCARALTLRMALPAALSGMFIHEELHKADQDELNRRREAAKSNLSAAYTQAVNTMPAPKAGEKPGEAPTGPLLAMNVDPNIEDADVIDDIEPETPAEPATAPVPDAQVEPQAQEPTGEQDAPAARTAAPEQPAAYTPEQSLRFLQDEVTFMAQVMEKPVEELLARKMSLAKVTTIGALSAEALAEFVRPMRGAVANRLREAGDEEAAAAYAAVPAGVVGPVEALLGR